MRKAIAIYLGCAVIAAYVILRAWDHFRGLPPIEPDPWATLPQPDLAPIRPKSVIFSDNLTAADPVVWWSGWQTSRWN